MREPNLNDGRLTVRSSLEAKRKLNNLAKGLGVSQSRVLEQLIFDAPPDMKISVVAEDATEYGGKLAKGGKKLKEAAKALKERGYSKIKKARGKEG